MALAKLSIDLEARLGRLEQDMSRATRVMEQSAGKMQHAFSAAGAGIKGALTGALGAISISAITGAFAAIVRGLDNLNDSSSALGTTVENLSALEDIAARTGTKMDTVTTALTKFNAQIKEALTPGTEAARVFELLGLNAKELAELDPAEALLKTAQALATFADDGAKARVVYALFGKSMAETAEFLKNVAEAGKLNATVTTEQAREAAKFADEMSRLQKSIVDLGRAIGGPVISELNRIIQLFRDGAKEGRSFWHVLAFGDLSKGSAGGGATSSWDDTTNYGNEGLRGRRSIGNIPDKPKSGAAKIDEAERYLEALHKQFATTLDLSAEEQVRFDLANGRLKVTKQVTEEMLITAAKMIDQAKEEDKWQKELTKSVQDRADAYNKEYEAAIAAGRANEQADMDRLRGIVARTPGGQDELRQRDVQFLQRMLDQGKLGEGEEGIKRYAEAITEIFGLGEKELKKTKTLAEELGLSFASAFEDAIVGGKGLSDVIKGLEADITRLLLRKLVTEPAADWITGAIKGMGGSGGASGMLGGIGSWFSSMFSGWFADGGYIAPGKWGMAGERGPEPVFGGRSGATVRPYSGAVTINISVPGNTDGRTAQQVAVAAARAVATAQRRGA